MPPRRRRDPYRRAVLGVRRTPRRHDYAGDGIEDHNGEDRCRICGRPESNTAVHNDRTTSTELREAEARRFAEHEEP